MNIQDVIEVFNNYYSKDNVYWDSINNNLIIHWDTIEIKNEYDEKIKIYDLYGRVSLKELNNNVLYLKLDFIKTTYTKSQWDSRYIHSHISTSRKYNEYSPMCLGSGPIKGTIAKLILPNTIEDWMLFAWELDKLVRVESIEGVPYIRLSEVINGNIKPLNNTITISTKYSEEILSDKYCLDDIRTKLNTVILNSFLPYILKKEIFKFSFSNGVYKLGMSYSDYLIKISNLFIEWYNSQSIEFKKEITKEKLLSLDVIKYMPYKNGKLAVSTSSYKNPIDINTCLNTKLIEFKGKPVFLKLIDEPERNNNKVLIFTYYNFPLKLIYRVLKLMNYTYGKENSTTNKKTRIF